MSLFVLSRPGPEPLKKFKRRNLPSALVTFVDAFEAKAVDRLYMAENGLLDANALATDAQIADVFSHVIQWSQCAASGANRTIATDRSSIPENFEEESAALVARISTPWDLIVWGVDYNGLLIVKMPHQLGDCVIKYDDHPSAGASRPLEAVEFPATLMPLSAMEGISAYTVSPAGASKLLGSLPIREYVYRNKCASREVKGFDIGVLFSMLIENKIISSYVSFPPLIVGKLPEDVFPSVGAIGEAFDYSRPDMKLVLDRCLREAGCAPIPAAIVGSFPKLIHFVETTPKNDGLDEIDYFSNKKHPGVRPFGFSHYMAVRSAAAKHPGFRVLVWCLGERGGPYWEAIKEIAEIVTVPMPQRIFGNPVMHPAHRSDIVRMCVLLNYGGIYLDLDTITIQNMESICSPSRTVMAQELASTTPRAESESLGNAIMISPPGAEFMAKWWDAYRYFDSRFWAHSSTKMPYLLSKAQPDLVHVLRPEAFFVPSWDQVGLEALFERKSDFPEAFVFHLWESMAWPILKEVDERAVFRRNDTYSTLCRDYLDVGALAGLEKARQKRVVFHEKRETEPGLPAIFRDIYNNNEWGGEGKIYSGVGSDPERCEDYINFMSHYITRIGAKVVLDVGCGDFRVGSQIAQRCPATQFLAFDVVEDVVARNKMVYAGLDNVTFDVLNLVEQSPTARCDLVIVKDVFQHLSNRSIMRAFDNLRDFPEIITVNYMLPDFPIVNDDKEDGKHIRGGRLDFTAPPFNLQTEVVAKLIIKGSPGMTEVVRYRPL
ncbi:glycosyltransferase [Asaia sp. BMEF1]|uniref:glycosyltransferase n=1 Tax=Asaia sp. BMEF1 TaxID=3155932 RepID=UPI003F66C581